MNIATYQLSIPTTVSRLERRAACTVDWQPARPARQSPIAWLRARWTPGTPAAPAATTGAMIAADARTRGGIATEMPRID
jgi:hypothetical protein